ncbi:HIT family protein [bacterium]|nr:HIT family protein [bacterium]
MHDCPFCNIDREILAGSDLCLAIYDKYPVNKGHVLVVSRRHVEDYFSLEQDEVEEIWKLVEEVKGLIQLEFQPAGFNIGFNVGPVAGQTIDHVHIHVIPRYEGDMEDPTGGVRHVIPGKGKY